MENFRATDALLNTSLSWRRRSAQFFEPPLTVELIELFRGKNTVAFQKKNTTAAVAFFSAPVCSWWCSQPVQNNTDILIYYYQLVATQWAQIKHRYMIFYTNFNY